MHKFETLARRLLSEYGKNENGCIRTDYAKIAGLRVKASSTNGTSGLGVYRGTAVYWHFDNGLTWKGADVGLVLERTPAFIVEHWTH
jgi:hypothetical protein